MAKKSSFKLREDLFKQPHVSHKADVADCWSIFDVETLQFLWPEQTTYEKDVSQCISLFGHFLLHKVVCFMFVALKNGQKTSGTSALQTSPGFKPAPLFCFWVICRFFFKSLKLKEKWYRNWWYNLSWLYIVVTCRKHCILKVVFKASLKALDRQEILKNPPANMDMFDISRAAAWCFATRRIWW